MRRASKNIHCIVLGIFLVYVFFAVRLAFVLMLKAEKLTKLPMRKKKESERKKLSTRTHTHYSDLIIK